MKARKLKAIIITIASSVAAFFLVINPIATVAVYESIFGTRYETAEWLSYTVRDFDGLSVEECDFYSDGTRLSGYKYFRADTTPTALLVISHGLGGGGHNSYMNIVDYFTRVGYFVFSYDATANDKSDGNAVGGLPRGVIDLDLALDFITAEPECENMPVLLLGHSWGGYSAISVLNFHPEVTAAVSVAGFANSRDMIAVQSSPYVGIAAPLLLPYVELYEYLKYGDYSRLGGVDGIECSNAAVMIIHSSDDATVPTTCGYDIYYEKYSDDPRVEFILFEDRGHNYVLNSEASAAVRDGINAEYLEFINQNGGTPKEELKLEFMSEALDKSTAFALDNDLMSRIFGFYENAISKTE